MAKKVLVTGGSGFIGGHVVDKLIEQGHQVSIFDRFNTKAHRDDVAYFLGDVKDRDAVFEAVYKHDAVINLAGLLGTAETINTPAPSVEVNILGALNIFDACRLHGRRGVQIAVGNWFMNNSYAITKYTAERFAFMYNKEHGTKIAVVRGLNAYGERQKHRPVRKIVPNLVVPALLNKPITIYGDGTQIMDMIYVGDMADILIRAALDDHGNYSAVMEAGMGDDITINQLAEMAVRLAGSSSEIRHVQMRAGETERSIVKGDPSTLAPLNYTKDQMTTLENGMQKTIDWYRAHLDAFPWDE